ncbi:MAG: hypothetical protein ACXW3V_05785 [Methylocystis sp.]
MNLLDQIDADADLEEDNPPEDDAPCEDVSDNEPSLGAPGASSFPPQHLWRRLLTTIARTKASYLSRPATMSRCSAPRQR